MSHAGAHHGSLLEERNVSLGAGAGGAASIGLIVAGLAGIAATVFAGMGDASGAARTALMSYHIGFLFVLALSLGSLGLVMVFHQTGAGWSAVIRRVFEQVMWSVPLALALFVPVLVLSVVPGIVKPGLLFKWMNPEYVAGDVLYQKKEAFLNVPFFVIRAVIYFAVWIALAGVLRKLSLGQDIDGDKWRTWKMRRISAPGLLLLALTAAFASFDWIMALDYHFFSTMFGVYFFAISMVSTMSFCVLTLLVLRAKGRLHGVFTGEHLHDMGKLVWGLTIFWAYIGFSQYFLIWYANIPEETAWLLARREGGWLSVSTALAVGKFAIPFIVLLARPARRSVGVMTVVCVWVLVMTLVDLFWLIRPELKPAGTPSLEVTWVDVVGPLGPIAIFVGVFIRRLGKAPLIPTKDPRLDLSLHHVNHI
ncbi:MAG: quinol:cytochrome C oxidoreductase [Phycisphaerales bacterium]